jgi:hypothetical protein
MSARPTRKTKLATDSDGTVMPTDVFGNCPRCHHGADWIHDAFLCYPKPKIPSNDVATYQSARSEAQGGGATTATIRSGHPTPENETRADTVLAPWNRALAALEKNGLLSQSADSNPGVMPASPRREEYPRQVSGGSKPTPVAKPADKSRRQR